MLIGFSFKKKHLKLVKLEPVTFWFTVVMANAPGFHVIISLCATKINVCVWRKIMTRSEDIVFPPPPPLSTRCPFKVGDHTVEMENKREVFTHSTEHSYSPCPAHSPLPLPSTIFSPPLFFLLKLLFFSVLFHLSPSLAHFWFILNLHAHHLIQGRWFRALRRLYRSPRMRMSELLAAYSHRQLVV